MAARKVQLKDNSGNKAYPVTSSACVGMSDGSGNLDEKISGIISNSGYVTCTAAAGTAAKTVTQANFTLSTNCRLIVKMTNYNTAASPTLNVNNTGAKPLYYNGEVASADNTWEAGEVLDVYYDGTNYQASNIQGGFNKYKDEILNILDIQEFSYTDKKIGYIRFTDGELVSSDSSNYVYYYDISGVKSLSVKTSAYDNIPAAIAFYNSENEYLQISSIQAMEGTNNYDVTIPSDAAIMAVTCGNKAASSVTEVFKPVVIHNNVKAELQKSITNIENEITDIKDKLTLDIQEFSYTDKKIGYIRFTDGELVSSDSSNYVYYYDISGVKSLSVKTSAYDNIPAAIAFYNSENEYLQISSIQAMEGTNNYDVTIPSDAAIMAVTCGNKAASSVTEVFEPVISHVKAELQKSITNIENEITDIKDKLTLDIQEFSYTDKKIGYIRFTDGELVSSDNSNDVYYYDISGVKSLSVKTSAYDNIPAAIAFYNSENEYLQGNSMQAIAGTNDYNVVIPSDAAIMAVTCGNKAASSVTEVFAPVISHVKADRLECLENKIENVNVNPENISISKLDGVDDHNTPNLLNYELLEKTFDDGTNSFTPPNEGYEMSNPIECQAGDWFTRTGTATGMVVVTDENDKNGTRLFDVGGATLPNTFQIPTNMTWVKFIRMAVDVTGAQAGTTVICKGKKAYVGDDRGDFIGIPKLRVERRNLAKDVMYIKSEDGSKYYELYVNSNGELKIKEVNPDVIPENELPEDWVEFTLAGDFNDKFDRICIFNNKFLIDLCADGIVKYLAFGNAPLSNYGNFEHVYNLSGEGRYIKAYNNSDESSLTQGKKIVIYDDEFNIVDENIPNGDIHDFLYFNDDHIIRLDSHVANVNIEGVGNKQINGIAIVEMKKQNGGWVDIAHFYATDYPKLCTDAFGELGDVIDSHQNTVSLDYDGNILLNMRNWESFVKIKREVKSNGTVILGSETLDYNEAIIGRVGGRHNSGYIDSKRVLNNGFNFTDMPIELTEVSNDDWEEWQWFHSHDVKYWGMKEIDGVQYPTYTLFDNNYWTNNNYVAGQYNSLNKNNNINKNELGDSLYYQDSRDGNENYSKYTCSRVIQMSIDWENHKVMDYRIYIIPKFYSKEQGGATMYDEGIISVSYSYQAVFGLWDFTTEETKITGNIYTGGKELFKGDYNHKFNYCYRANTYKIR